MLFLKICFVYPRHSVYTSSTVLPFSDHHVKRIGCEEDAATFQIDESANLSEVFRKMEQLTKEEFESLHICNYSISQASLEQVISW